MRDEPEKEVVHRLEAFSDIVIGFSLAQLGLTLTIPSHARDLFTHVRGAGGLFALIVTFALVCGVWWSHHRLFRHLFVPTALNIVANFAALCGVILLAYSMQLLVHFSFSDHVAFAMYTGSYAWIYSLFALAAWNSLRLRRERMSAEDSTDGMRFAVRASLFGIYLMAVTIATVRFGFGSSAAQWFMFGLLLVGLLARFLTRARVKQIANV
ncbi:MAG TPA: TMEM175 family protein [Candidatus Baltobacteraceae bacterium]|nr:TMEM175 family protein [Candidatus Baltobacteraceae bacterium]